MTTQEVHRMRDLVRVLNDGIDFYRDAEAKVQDTNLKRTFERMATTREKLINRLQPYIVMQEGEAEHGHTVSGRMRELYTSMLASMKADSDQTYIDHLESLEDKTLEELRAAISDAENVEVVAALREFHPRLKQCHEEMRALKRRPH